MTDYLHYCRDKFTLMQPTFKTLNLCENVCGYKVPTLSQSQLSNMIFGSTRM